MPWTDIMIEGGNAVIEQERGDTGVLTDILSFSSVQDWELTGSGVGPVARAWA